MLPRIIDDFISETERQQLLPWVAAMRPHLNPNGFARHFTQFDLLPQVPALCGVIRQRVMDTLELHDIEEPRFRCYLSTIDPGGAIHRHRDGIMLAGYDHWRCNLFLALPRVGGRPIVEGKTYAVRERSLLYFTPNHHFHWSDEVMDGTRIILSFGFLFPIGAPHEIRQLGR